MYKRTVSRCRISTEGHRESEGDRCTHVYTCMCVYFKTSVSLVGRIQTTLYSTPSQESSFLRHNLPWSLENFYSLHYYFRKRCERGLREDLFPCSGSSHILSSVVGVLRLWQSVKVSTPVSGILSESLLGRRGLEWKTGVRSRVRLSGKSRSPVGQSVGPSGRFDQKNRHFTLQQDAFFVKRLFSLYRNLSLIGP